MFLKSVQISFRILFAFFWGCALKVLNMRLRGAWVGEGGHLNLQKLFYLSVHTIDGNDGVKYAKNRVARELLDRWLERKFSFAGLEFQEEEQRLTGTESGP